MQIKKGETEKAELVFVPVPGIGHLVSTLEFAKRLVNRDDRISITILIIKFSAASFVDAYIKSLASHPRIKLIDLPDVDNPPLDLLQKSVEAFICTVLESHVPHVKRALDSIMSSAQSSSGSVRVVGLVVDLFCVSMIDVADEFDIPSYIFLTSNAGFLDLMFYLPTRHSQITTVFEKTDPEILMPGFVNSVPVSVLPGALFNRDGGYDSYIKIAKPFRDVKGIMVNTFEGLEQYTLGSFSHSQVPPVYPVGPILDLKGLPNPDSDQDEHDRIMQWLDDQPESSVVFLCFGSMGSFEATQIREIAVGLDHSEYRFLWSIRVPPTKIPEDMLPEGFLERIEGRGMICGWAPQVKVLAHKAVGGFVSHCGWNSTLESLWCGVPIVTWPLYAEQQLNAFRLVRELSLAVELRLDYRKDSELVAADEIEKSIRCLMNSDNPVRNKVKAISDMAKKALMDGGSSFNSIGRLIEDMMGRS